MYIQVHECHIFHKRGTGAFALDIQAGPFKNHFMQIYLKRERNLYAGVGSLVPIIPIVAVG